MAVIMKQIIRLAESDLRNIVMEAVNKILAEDGEIGGGGATVPGLLEYISEKTGIETATVNPFRSVECDSSVVDKEGMSVALSNIYAPALGLAMRKF